LERSIDANIAECVPLLVRESNFRYALTEGAKVRPNDIAPIARKPRHWVL